MNFIQTLLIRSIILFQAFCFTQTSWSSESSQEIAPHREWSFSDFSLIPVQSGGRIKPFDSFARELVLFQTGSRSYRGWNSVDLMLSWIAHPQYWELQPLIRVSREDVRRQLGLDENRTFFTPQELFKNSILLQYATQIENKAEGTEPPGAPRANAREKEFKSVLDRLSIFHNVVTGQGWFLIPKPAPEAWENITTQNSDGKQIQSQFAEVVQAYLSNNKVSFEYSSQLLKQKITERIEGYPENIEKVVQAEVIYNKFRPFLWAWIFYLGAMLIWTAEAWVTDSRKQSVKKIALGITVIGAISQIVGIGLRCFIAGRPPVTNMYESVIWVSFGVIGFAAILYAIHRQAVIFAVATALATLGLIAGDVAPAVLDPSIHPLVPVLRSNYWLTVHVLTITLGYAAFALTLGLADITLFHFLKNSKSQTISNLNQLTYRAMQFGVVLIAAGTILGGIWADYSWGRFWGWDPKEVWALITLLSYLTILHGRFTNWVGQFAFAALSAVSFLSVVMAWYGVNFILGVGLHSYGFSTGGTPWVFGFVAIQLAYIGFVAVVRTQR